MDMSNYPPAWSSLSPSAPMPARVYAVAPSLGNVNIVAGGLLAGVPTAEVWSLPLDPKGAPAPNPGAWAMMKNALPEAVYGAVDASISAQ
jgi:hypothetical protein